MILDFDHGYIFEVSCDKRSRSYFSLKYDDNVGDWSIRHSLSMTIPTKKLIFIIIMIKRRNYEQVRIIRHYFRYVLLLM